MTEGASSDNEGRGDPEDAWPSIKDAYAFVPASYDWAIRRFDAMDARLRQIGMAAATVTLGVPVAAGAVVGSGLAYWWLYAIGASLGAIVALMALVAHTREHLTLVSLDDLWNQNLEKPRWEFRKDQIFFAAERQESNHAIIERRGRLAVYLAVAFGGQVLVMALWLGLNLAMAGTTCS